MNPDRSIPGDWFPGRVPPNVSLHPEAYVETTYSFHLFHSRQPEAVRIERGASLYLGVMFDLGPEASVSIGSFSLVHGTRFVADSSIHIGSHCLLSWNTVLMEAQRRPADSAGRREALVSVARSEGRRLPSRANAHPIRIGDGVWIGFDSCVLPGVTIGDGAIVGARSVVMNSVPPFAIVAGNPARLVRQLNPEESRQAMAVAMAELTPCSQPPNLMSAPKGKIIVFGILFFYPLAGVTYQFLHYLIALRRLGYDPYYVEDSARWIYDPRLNDISPDVRGNLELVLPALREHGFEDRWCFRGKYEGGGCFGLSESQLAELYRDADAFLNVTGAQEIREEHRSIKRRIYVESDPFAMQVKLAMGNTGAADFLGAHDCHFSFGENLGAPDCPVPIQTHTWQPTRQPVLLDLWEGAATGGDTYNTITTWHNTGKDIDWQGDRWYWTKDREFEKFLDLPRRRPSQRFELAATVDGAVLDSLQRNGWRQRSSIEISRDANRYRSYIQEARGEFTVARDQYVRPKTGWFSDRTVCYLAAGRPVITQETGFSKYVPSGRGLFGFTTMDDILRAVDAIESDYAGNCQAAREVAAEYFGAEKVVGSLLKRAGV